MKLSSRTRVLLFVPILAAGFIAAGAGPVSAASIYNPNANCVGQIASQYNAVGKFFGLPGYGGQVISGLAPVSYLATSNCQI
jgi:hypothetical protein